MIQFGDVSRAGTTGPIHASGNRGAIDASVRAL